MTATARSRRAVTVEQTSPISVVVADRARTSLRYGRTQVGLGDHGVHRAAGRVRPAVRARLADGAGRHPVQPAVESFPLGTDYVGDDVLSRVLWGGRCVRLDGVRGRDDRRRRWAPRWALRRLLRRSRLDEAIMRSLDVLLAFPAVVFILLFVSMLGSSPRAHRPARRHRVDARRWRVPCAPPRSRSRTASTSSRPR